MRPHQQWELEQLHFSRLFWEQTSSKRLVRSLSLHNYFRSDGITLLFSLPRVCRKKTVSNAIVVALFNAISKRQTENAPGGSASAGTGSSGAGTAKSASRHAFLDMLKTGVKPAAGPAEPGGKGSTGAGFARGTGWNKDEGGEVGCLFHLFFYAHF